MYGNSNTDGGNSSFENNRTKTRINTQESYVFQNPSFSKGDIAYSSDFPHTLKIASEDNQKWSNMKSIRPVTEFTPDDNSATGLIGTICFDNDYLYIRTEAGWKKVALSDMPFTTPAIPT